MEYRKWGERLVPRLDPEEEVGECLLEVGKKENTRLAEISGLGTASLVELEMFDTETKGFTEACYQGAYGAVSITGSITRLDREPYLHVHTVIGNLDRGECHEGHTTRAVTSTTTEIFVNIMFGQVERKMNEETGPHLLDL